MFSTPEIIGRYYEGLRAEPDHYGRLKVGLSIVVPIIAALVAAWLGDKVDPEILGGFLGAFSILAGLLLNVQAGIFSLYDRTPPPPTDPKLFERYNRKTTQRRRLIKGVNSAISYLLLVSSLLIVSCAIFLIVDGYDKAIIAVVAFIFSHFMVNLLILIERVDALYTVEFSNA